MMNVAVMLKSMLVGFLESVMRFATTMYDMFLNVSTFTLMPKWASDILKGLNAPQWLQAFAQGHWLTFLITNLFSLVLVGLLTYKIIMRLIQLINPLN